MASILKKNDNRFKGLVHFGIDNDNLSIKSWRYSPFTDQFIFDKYGKEKEKELRNIRFKEVHVNEKNELILNGEERYVTSHFMNMQNYIIYHYEDIISAKLDSSGKLIWARNINKSQASRKISPYLSYTSVYRNGKIYFFINGSEEVREMTNDRIEFGIPLLKKMNLYAISLNDAGKMDYKKIIEDDESDVSFSAGNGLILNDGECLIFQGRRKRKKQITRLEL
ncbi:hypothetical protein G3I01_05380 [Gramella sp. MT6]|uniref:hypothetical protein n=1 Tax=Gramella sp. MT6 TaxID=2705471 RepID=UPI001C5E17FC|nr:hypothetical protein [Gramella sp. MT6]QYA24965.1 hypothetical protein G3I01_05380 [Gramella sp. MT6]